MLSLVVTGMPREIQIAKPAGLGLGEKLVGAVSKLNDGAGKDARPVPVKIKVENFLQPY